MKIIPLNSLQAISRLIERNELSYEDAEKRWLAGIDNYSVVQNSDVVFATQWKHDFTQVQVSSTIEFRSYNSEIRDQNSAKKNIASEQRSYYHRFSNFGFIKMDSWNNFELVKLMINGGTF